jgi:DNA-binding transcriptional MocR family regulator
MSLRRRQELVKLARKSDMLIISDDIYDMLQWKNPDHILTVDKPAKEPSLGPQHMNSEAPGKMKEEAAAMLPRLVDIERELMSAKELGHAYGHTCSNGSFSKLVAPGLRVGWVEATEKFVLGLSQV